MRTASVSETVGEQLEEKNSRIKALEAEVAQLKAEREQQQREEKGNENAV